MRIAILVLVSIINAIIQSTFYLYFSNAFILPNTMLVIVISYSIVRDDAEGAVFGFFNGLMFDILFGRIIGLYALIGLITGFVAAKPFREFSPNNFIIPSVTIFTMTIFYEFLFFIFAFLFKGRTDLLYYLLHVIIPEAIVNVIIAIIIYPAIFYYNKYFTEKEKHKRKMFSSIGGNSGKIS